MRISHLPILFSKHALIYSFYTCIPIGNGKYNRILNICPSNLYWNQVIIIALLYITIVYF